MHRSLGFRPAVLLLLVPVALLLGACDRGVTEADDDHEEFHRLQVIDRGQVDRPVVATWTAGQGWSGTLPAVSLSSTNQRISIGFRVFDEDGDELSLSEDGESIRYALATGAAQGIIDMGRAANVLYHGDHVYIYGVTAGTTRIQFLLWHIDHADDATDPIDITVVN